MFAGIFKQSLNIAESIGASVHFASQIVSGLRFLLDKLASSCEGENTANNSLIIKSIGALVSVPNQQRFKSLDPVSMEELLVYLNDDSAKELWRCALYSLTRLMDRDHAISGSIATAWINVCIRNCKLLFNGVHS